MDKKKKTLVVVISVVLLAVIGFGVTIYRKEKLSVDINVLAKKLEKSVVYNEQKEKKDELLNIYKSGIDKKSGKEKREYKDTLEAFTKEVRNKNIEDMGEVISSLKTIDFSDGDKDFKDKMTDKINAIEKEYIKRDFVECNRLLLELKKDEKKINEVFVMNNLEGVYKQKDSYISGGYSSTDISVINNKNGSIIVAYRQQNSSANGGGDASSMEGTIRRVSGTRYKGRISTNSSAFGGIDSYEDIDITFEKDKARVIFGRGEAVVLPRIEREDKFS